MWLTVEPDFESQRIKCKQQLKLVAKDGIDTIELDSAGLEIESVFFSQRAMTIRESSNNDLEKTLYESNDNKLRVQLGRMLPEDSLFYLFINYSAKPKRGFNFVTYERNGKKHVQAWTQGEASESKYWFPCFDHPEMKFSREISVIVPENFIVISNGELDLLDTETKGKKKYVWEELNPNPSYLTAVVIGEFAETSRGQIYDDRVPLGFFVPKDREDDADRTFNITSNVLKIFEQYFNTKFPYSKYSQITIEDFPYGGMENTTCTTLTTDVLHDKLAHMDYSSDDVVAHELAHHWFGDLITCRDWQHIWLNEGFATYSEALYFEYRYGFDMPDIDMFQYKVLQMADGYIDEAKNLYTRALVTKVYNNADELFDVGHTYDKAGFVLHMIRSYIGDNEFRKSLKKYLEQYRNKTAETDELRRVFEEMSGKSLQEFFDQWLYRLGHPVLEIEFYYEEPNDEIKVQITQTQVGDVFEFPLDIRLVFSDDRNDKRSEVIPISEKKLEKIFKIPHDKKIKYISIDPDLKVLKEIRSIKISTSGNDDSSRQVKNMLKNQILEGKTIYERIQAVRALNENYYSDELINLLKVTILDNKSEIVSSEAATALGLVVDSPYSDLAYNNLIECLSFMTNSKIRTSLINALGKFRRVESFKVLEQILDRNDESYFVKEAASTAIGWIGNKESWDKLESLLETGSFQEVIAQGALAGLTITTLLLRDSQLIERFIEILIKKSNDDQYHAVREAAAVYLGYFVSSLDGTAINRGVFNRLKELLIDRWVFVRNSACITIGIAFENKNNQEAIDALEQVASNDSDGQVRRTALENIENIKKKPIQALQMITIQDIMKLGVKFKSKEVEVMQRRIPRK